GRSTRDHSCLPRAETGVDGRSGPPRGSGESLGQRLPFLSRGDRSRRAGALDATEGRVARATTPVSRARRRERRGGRARRDGGESRPRGDGSRRAVGLAARERGVARATTPVSRARRPATKGGRARRGGA